MRASRFRRQAEPHSRQAGHLRVLLEVILARWINEQAAYFSRAVRNERSKSLRIKTGSTICLIASGVLAIVLAVSVLRGLPAYRDVLIMLLTLALAGAGLFTGYAQKRAHEEHARRYQRMRVLYKIAGERVSSFLHENDLVSTCAVLVQLGREALAETCDWLLLHRERQIDVPTT
jgi:accessory gene regulator protein AgrB